VALFFPNSLYHAMTRFPS